MKINVAVFAGVLAAVLFQGLPVLAADLPPRVAIWGEKAPVGEGNYGVTNAYVSVYRPEKGNGAAIVICPGGGYGGLCVRPEGTGIAEWLNKHGITGIVLEYRLPRGNRFVPLLDAQQAVRLARARAAELGCDPKRIGVMGFSAGGHLAATAATHFDDGVAGAADEVARQSCRPDFCILVYPVITMGEKTHQGSRRNLLGLTPDAATVELYSNEKQVTGRTPPTFLAHALDDKGVVPENSRMFYDALREHKVEAKYLELPNGGHGLSGYRGPSWDAWQAQSLEWLAALKIIPAADAQPAGK